MSRKSTGGISWVAGALKAFQTFPLSVQLKAARALTQLSRGDILDTSRSLDSLGADVGELSIAKRGEGFLVTYVLVQGQDLWVVRALEKKSQTLTRPRLEDAMIQDGTKAKGDVDQISPAPPLDVVRGSSNLFADLGLPNAGQEHFRAILAAEIGKALTADGLTPRAGKKITGVAAADFSRIRQARLKSFTVDRLMTILNRLNRKVRVSVSVVP